MLTKDFHGAVKAAGEADGLKEGQVTAVISVFGNVDSVGDVVMPGAFKDNLAEWEAKGDPIPFIWSHDWSDPFSHIGSIIKAEETDRGLQVTAQIEDVDTNPKAAQVYRLLKGRRVTQFSFAYEVEDAAEGERDGQPITELRKLRIFEGGPTLVGANQATELLAAKARGLAADAKAGRVLSGKNYARLVEARDALSEVLEAAAPTDAEKQHLNHTHVALDANQTSGTDVPVKTEVPSQVDEPAAKDQEPDGATSEEPPAKSAPRRALAVALITNLS